MCDIEKWSGRFCPDCGVPHPECKCGRQGYPIPSVPVPKYNVGDSVYREGQTSPPMKVLDRACVMSHEAECEDGYDGHSANSSWKIKWRYVTTCHWKDSTSYNEEELTTRAEHVPYVVWYYAVFSNSNGEYGLKDVKKCIVDITAAEYARALEDVEAALESARAGEEAVSRYPFLESSLIRDEE